MFEIIDIDELIKRLNKHNYKEAHIHHTFKPDHAQWKSKPDAVYWQNVMDRYHTLIKKWSEIAQHVTLLPNGLFVTGRDLAKNPASIIGYSIGAFMVETFGNFDIGNDKLEGKQKASLLALARYFNNKGKYIRFHRENDTKTCPGTSIGKNTFMQEVKGDIMIDKVRDFQKRNDLVIDGDPGSKTVAKAREVLEIINYILNYKKPEPVKDTYNFKIVDGTRVYGINPINFTSSLVKDKAANLVKTHKNFINGMFSIGDRVLCLLIVNGKKLAEPKPYDVYDKGTFIIYNDGRVEIKTLRDIQDVSNIRLAWQGINCNYEANGSKSLIESMRKEYWCYKNTDGTWNDYVYLRVCRRAAVGYNPQTNKIIIVSKVCGVEEIRRELRKHGCITKDGDTLGVIPDAGDSFAEAADNKLIYGTSRILLNILKFN